MSQAELMKIIVEGMTDQNSEDERQSIPHSSRYHTDQSVNQWIRQEEAVSTMNAWDDTSKKKHFASRLKRSALNWYMERLQENVNEEYVTWKKALIEHFRHPTDKDKHKVKFEKLKQNPKYINN